MNKDNLIQLIDLILLLHEFKKKKKRKTCLKFHVCCSCLKCSIAQSNFLSSLCKYCKYWPAYQLYLHNGMYRTNEEIYTLTLTLILTLQTG